MFVETYLSAIRSTIVSVGTSKLITRSTWTVSSKCCAWYTFLGKPSRSRDLPCSRFGVATSMTRPIIKSSGTNFPSFMYFDASFPILDCTLTCSRSKSPVEMWWNWGKSCKENNNHCELTRSPNDQNCRCTPIFGHSPDTSLNNTNLQDFPWNGPLATTRLPQDQGKVSIFFWRCNRHGGHEAVALSRDEPAGTCRWSSYKNHSGSCIGCTLGRNQWAHIGGWLYVFVLWRTKIASTNARQPTRRLEVTQVHTLSKCRFRLRRLYYSRSRAAVLFGQFVPPCE